MNLNVHKPNGKVYIEVKDNDLRFNPEDAKLIFKRGTTKGKRGTCNEPSTGIGLYTYQRKLQKRIKENYMPIVKE